MVDCEIALVLLFVVAIFCCFVGAYALTAVGFVVTVCCCVGDDDTADVCGVAADNKCGFTVFGMPHIFDSVVLTTLRLWLLGSHSFALSSGGLCV
jgi:hypothetical protein